MTSRTLTATAFALAVSWVLPSLAQTYQFRAPVPALQVVAEVPAFSLSATVLDFGGLAVPATKSLSMVVTNVGNVPLAAPAIATSGGGFSATHNCEPTLAVGAECTVTGTFAPLSAGEFFGSLSAQYIGLPAQPVTLRGSATVAASSCATILGSNPGAASGQYTLTPSVGAPYSVYCDMTSDGGGWTRIVRQTEAAPVNNWNGGVNGASYALATVQIPAHTQIAFGKNEAATFVDYVVGTYSTGDISTIVLTSPRSGRTYQLSRQTSAFYVLHDPEHALYGAGYPQWHSTLTFDRTGGSAYSWAFSPNAPLSFPSSYAGYALLGDLQQSVDTFAWTVWVR